MQHTCTLCCSLHPHCTRPRTHRMRVPSSCASSRTSSMHRRPPERARRQPRAGLAANRLPSSCTPTSSTTQRLCARPAPRSPQPPSAEQRPAGACPSEPFSELSCRYRLLFEAASRNLLGTFSELSCRPPRSATSTRRCMSGAATRWGAHLAQPLPEARRRCESSAAEGALGCKVSVDFLGFFSDPSRILLGTFSEPSQNLGC